MRTSEDWSMDEVGGEQLPRSTNTWRRPGSVRKAALLSLFVPMKRYSKS